jgi:hypothetical protein
MAGIQQYIAVGAAAVFPRTAEKDAGYEKGVDELVKSRISDGFVKSPRSRLANPEE